MSKRIQIVQSYMDTAKNRPDECVKFVSDKIYLKSERDGIINGIKDFEKYAKKTKLEGTWDKPEAHPVRNDVVIVRGKITKLLSVIKVTTAFVFEEESDKVLKIIAGRTDFVELK